jgi:hypothetical protein
MAIWLLEPPESHDHEAEEDSLAYGHFGIAYWAIVFQN